MSREPSRSIRIAAALIDDDAGRLLLVRKAGTRWFMQTGGKIDEGESALCALRRELAEEIGLALVDEDARYLVCGGERTQAHRRGGNLSSPVPHDPDTRSEIEEAVWVDRSVAAGTVDPQPYPAAGADALSAIVPDRRDGTHGAR